MHELEALGPFFPGSKVGVLLVHGLAGTPSEMKTVASRLNRYGFTTLCPLLAGHCATEAELVATRWQDWTESALQAFDRLSAHMDVVFVGGLSAGAVLSLYVALHRPEQVRGLGLFSTTLRWDGWSIPKLRFLLPLVLRLPVIGKRYRFEEVFPYGIMNDRLRQKIVGAMKGGNSAEAGLTCTPGTSLRELWRLVALVKKDLPKITAPALLVHAKKDDIADLGNSLEVQKRLGGPSELLLLHNSYHMVTVDQERELVCDTTARFFHDLLSENEREELLRHARKPIPFTDEARS